MADFIGNDPTAFAERMLEAGFFPENIPPVFSVTNLHEAAIGPLAASTYLTHEKIPTEAARYNASKRGGQRRVFSMPNPVFMVDAATYFLAHQDGVHAHLEADPKPSSYPRFQTAGRAIGIASFPEFHRARREGLAMSRYVVRTDISRYFHSIYTHALPWALHGRAASKKDRKFDSATLFGNRLDWLVRQAQDGQTVGIPVGPDFSRIISEIIGTAIDKRFAQLRPTAGPMLRLVDDIYIGSDNLDDAQASLSALREALRSYELDINEAKTAIMETSRDLEPFWPVEIRREVERYAEDNQSGTLRSDLVHFLDEILRRAGAANDDGIVKFALRKIDEREIWSGYWSVLEPFLVRAAISFPHCWDYVARVVSWRHRSSDVNTDLWRDVIHRSVGQHASSGHDSEIAWALWLLKELGESITVAAFQLVLQRCGALPALIALDINDGASVPHKIPKADLLGRLGDRPMCSSLWILAFEGDRKFDLKIKSKNTQGNAFFQQLYDDDVSFYDRDAQPAVFEDAGDPGAVKRAIETHVSLYEEDAAADEEVGPGF